MRFRAAILVLVAGFPAFASPPSPEGVEFFEKNIRPVFVEHCVSCHGAKKQQAGLRLDTKAGLFKGTDDGPALVAGEPDKSKLVRAVRHDGEVKMPPKTKLPAAALEAIAAWVKMGAPYPDAAAAIVADPAATHWAYQPVKPITPPATKSEVTHPIDQFIQKGLEEKGLSLASSADKRTLIRRVTYDLTGLPPTPEESDAFLNDASPAAYERLIDRLLDSPRYGEQQARHWMDLARYADTKGYVFTEDRNYPYAYTYRDWLIRAFNDDLPYDRFIIYQLAADRAAKGEKAHLAAMGFLTVGRRFLNNVPDIIDDRLDATFRTFQGVTVGCARCHDHKFDPVPTKDYYSLYGVFASSVEPAELPLIAEPMTTPEVLAFEAELKKREEAVQAGTAKVRADTLNRLRSADSVAAYLVLVRDTRGMQNGLAGTLAAERKLLALMMDRWRAYLDGRPKTADPVFGIYHVLGAIADAEFAAAAPAALAKLLDESDPKKLNPLVAKAFTGPKLVAFADVAKTYGTLLASAWSPAVGPAIPATIELTDVLGPAGVLNFKERELRKFSSISDNLMLDRLRNAVQTWKANSAVAPARAMVLTDAPTPTQPVVFLRGNPNAAGPTVPRQFLGLVAGSVRKPFVDGSGRLEMALAIADPMNPLTARVFVNRAWTHLFGQGIVRTPSDFGTRSDPPTHPALLDWLAGHFVESGWSIKKLHRLIISSQAYQQSSAVTTEMARLDPESRLIARMSRKRMTFEGLRDALLLSAGRLDGTIGGKSVDVFKSPFPPRRSLYAFIDRQNLPGTLRSFDFALPDTHAPQRFTTTVPQQALFLMNSPFVMEQAKAVASRVGTGPTNERIAALYRLTLGRAPTQEELATAAEFVAGQAVEAGPSPWDQLAQVLLMSNEFAFVD